MSDHWKLTAAAIGWLRYKQRCPLVCWERSPFGSHFYRPDIIGVTRDRRVIEVELKESLADFKANREKRGIDWREKGLAVNYPLRFYYAVPRALVDRVRPFVLDDEGLLTIADGESSFGPEIECIIRATPDRRATKLSLFQMGRMVMHQTGTLHRAVKALATAEVLTIPDFRSPPPIGEPDPATPGQQQIA